MIHVLCLRDIGEEILAVIKQDLEGFCFYHEAKLPADEACAQAVLSKIEIVLGNPAGEMLKRLPNVKLIQSAFAGVDGIIGQGIPDGIILANGRGAYGRTIAEHMLGRILLLYKKLDAYYEQQKVHAWKDLGMERTLFGRRVLIVGPGNIGQTFAELLTVFHTTTIGVRRSEGARPAGFAQMHTLDTLGRKGMQEEIEKADIVALCLPSTSETKGFFDYTYLKHLKKNALVLNVGRGNVMPTADICRILQERGDIRFALDVFEVEPLAPESPLWEDERVLVTPHITGGSFGHLKETEAVIIDIIRENLVNYREGRPLSNVVDIRRGY